MESNGLNKPSVLIVVPNLGGGGLERMALLLAEALYKAGHPATLFAHEVRGDLLEQIPQGVAFVSHSGTRYTRRKLPGLLAASRQQMRRHDITIAAAEGRVAALCCMASIALRKPLICWVHNDWREFSLHTSSRALLSLHIMRRATRIVAVSHGAAVGLSEVTGISPDKIDVIWNGIDTERIMQAAQDPLPEPFTGTIGPRTILFAGRLTKQKGPDLLLEACGQLAHSGTMIDLVLVGQGKMYKALKTRAAELGLSQHVRFAGYQPNPFPFFSQAGVFVLPSRYEGFGLVVAEALACQIKIIASDCRSGPREILDNGAYGKLVKTGSVQALSEALDTALNHSEPQTDAACNAGLERARAFDMCVFQSDWAKYIAQFSRTYIPSG